MVPPSRPNLPEFERGRKRQCLSEVEKHQNHYRPVTKVADSDLCPDCQRIDFDKLSNLKPSELRAHPEGILIADLGTRVDVENDCQLCKLFSQSKRKFLTPDPNLQLRAFSYLQCDPGFAFDKCSPSHIDSDGPLLCVVSQGMTNRSVLSQARLEDDTGIPYNNSFMLFSRKSTRDEARPDGRIPKQLCLFKPYPLSSLFEVARIRDWLQFCTMFHPCCRNSHFRPVRRGVYSSHINNLKLIELRSLQVVVAPPAVRYVALSYVWGAGSRISEQSSEPPNETQSDRKQFGKTVLDAISVAMSLGFTYLWVDKYCIDHFNREEELNQIKNMNIIYQAAELTIVAAYGENSEAGLPGTFETPRHVVQDPVNWKGHQIFAASIPPGSLIKSSKWSTRGWTFQEGFFSRRRLIFTKSQVIFQCDTMTCAESLTPNLDEMHNPNKQTIHSCFKADPIGVGDARRFRQTAPEHLWQKLQHYEVLVARYSGRDLTYESDRMHAFAGIMRHYETQEWPLYFIWGIPCFLGPASAQTDRDTRLEELYLSFLHGLCWINLDFTLVNTRSSTQDGPPEKSQTEIAPTWSWAAWTGQVHYAFTEGVKFRTCLVEAIELGAAGQRTITLEKFVLTWKDESDLGSASAADRDKLFLTGPVLPTHMIAITDRNRLQLTDRTTISWIAPTREGPSGSAKPLQEGKLSVILISTTSFEKTLGYVVESKGEFHIRSGVCEIGRIFSADELEHFEKRTFSIM